MIYLLLLSCYWCSASGRLMGKCSSNAFNSLLVILVWKVHYVSFTFSGMVVHALFNFRVDKNRDTSSVSLRLQGSHEWVVLHGWRECRVWALWSRSASRFWVEVSGVVIFVLNARMGKRDVQCSPLPTESQFRKLVPSVVPQPEWSLLMSNDLSR